MKSAWDSIFNSDARKPLSPEEQEQALRELAKSVTDVSNVQASPEHQRISQLIREKLAQQAQEKSRS